MQQQLSDEEAMLAAEQIAADRLARTTERPGVQGVPFTAAMGRTEYPTNSTMFEPLHEEHIRTYTIPQDDRVIAAVTATLAAQEAAMDTLGIPASRLNTNPL